MVTYGHSVAILDDIEGGARKLEATARAEIRKEAAAGARAAVMPYVVAAIALALLALSRTGRR